MRKVLLFVFAVAITASGLWLLGAELFSSDIIFGAAVLTTLGIYLLTSFVEPLLENRGAFWGVIGGSPHRADSLSPRGDPPAGSAVLGG